MKKIKTLHLISYIAIIVFLVGMVITGWYGLPVYSFSFFRHGVGDLLKGRFLTGSVSQLIAAIIFILGTIAFIVFLVLLIVRAVKKGKKHYLAVSVTLLVITWVILAFFYVVYTASIGWNGQSVINHNIKNSFVWLFDSTSGTKLHLRAAFNIGCIVLVLVFVVLQIVAYFKTLKLIESDQVDDDSQVEVLTEDEMREIIREELVRFYEANPVASVAAPVVEDVVVIDEVVEEPVLDEVVEEPAVEEPAVEEPVAEEVVAEEPAVEEPVAEEPAVEEPAVEEVVEEVFERQEATVAVDANNNGRISFFERIVSLDQELLDDYNELKNELMSYGLKSRLSSTGDTFRLRRVTYCKMIFSGKKVKLYLHLDPKDYKDSTIPFDDVSHKKSFAEIPFVFKVKSGLSLRRAKALIKEMMDKAGIAQESEPKKVKYAENLIRDIKEGKIEL